MNPVATWRRLLAEFAGTALLVTAVVGSGIMAATLSPGNVGLQLLENSTATAFALGALILTFGPASGAHFNPVVTVAMATRGDIAWKLVPAYMLVQLASAVAGVGLADAMFDLPLYAWSRHVRAGPGQWLSEFIATFGLLGVIWVATRKRPAAVPALVGAYIGAAYWFTASTSFANPAVTIARAMTDTFAGIQPSDVFAFLISQALGAGAAIAIFGWLLPAPQPALGKEGSAISEHASIP